MRLLGILDGLKQDVYMPKVYVSSQTLGGAAGSIAFTGFPTDYTHLNIDIVARSAATSASVNTLQMKFNSSAVNNYSQYFGGAGATAGAAETIGGTVMDIGLIPNDTIADASFWGTTRIWIPFYANASLFYHHAQSESFCPIGNLTGNLFARTYKSYWASQGAISRIDLFVSGGNNFKTNTQAILTAIKV